MSQPDEDVQIPNENVQRCGLYWRSVLRTASLFNGQGFTILTSFKEADKLHFLAKVFTNRSFNVIKGYLEELLSVVDPVDSIGIKCAMQSTLKAWYICRVEHGMDIKGERYRSTAEFLDPFRGGKLVCHTNLVDVLTERTDVGDDIDFAWSGAPLFSLPQQSSHHLPVLGRLAILPCFHLTLSIA